MTNTRQRAWSAGQLPNRGKKQETLTPGERRRVRQLVACLLLFGVVFLGRGTTEGRLHDLTQTLGSLVHSNTDFRAVFAEVGQAVSEGGSVVETFGRIWTGVFGGEAEPTQGTGEQVPPTGDGAAPPPEDVPPVADTTTQQGQETQEPVAPAAPTETTPPATQAEAPAANTSTGIVEGETATPVMGVLTSSFGYRTHPIDKEWKQHDGIDIMANEGTAILAFADGVVDYIGQSPAYGNYLQIKHSNGVTTFYAHCSELLVKAGQKVSVGETVAKVGATGNVTGAHLHLEMKKDGVRIDPAQYVQTLAK